MPRKPKARDFFEPWTAIKSKIGRPPFEGGVPEEVDPEAAERIRSTHEKLEAQADVVIWGRRMVEPVVARGLISGQTVVMDDTHLICVVRKQTSPEDAPTHDEVARRMCDCVSACAGIADPKFIIEGLKTLLLDMLRGSADVGDTRVLSLLSRMYPPESKELEVFGEAEDFGD